MAKRRTPPGSADAGTGQKAAGDVIGNDIDKSGGGGGRWEGGVGSHVVALVVGAVVGSLVTALLYPAIAGLLLRRQLPSYPHPHPDPDHGHSHQQDDVGPEAGFPMDDTRPRAIREAGGHGETAPRGQGRQPGRHTGEGQPGPEETSRTSPVARGEGGGGPREDQRNKCRHGHSGDSSSESCHPSAASGQRPEASTPRGEQASPTLRGVGEGGDPGEGAEGDAEQGEQFEEEEEEEEEDSTEVVLMEDDDERANFVELKADEDDGAAVDGKAERARAPGVEKDVHRTDSLSAGVNTAGKEPVVIGDGQPVTFTPVNPGDDQIIRLGGRPKPGKKAEKQIVKQTEKQTLKQAEKQAVKQVEKQAEKQTEKQTVKQTLKQTKKQTEKQAERETRKTRKQTASIQAEELQEGQPITLTPMNPGDDQIIRIGGRPKPGKQTEKQMVKQTVKQTTAAPKTEDGPQTDARNKPGREAGPAVGSGEGSKKAEKDHPKRQRAGEEGGQDEMPEEVQKFRPTFQRTFTATKIFADGRRIPPVELLPQKETNSSVRVFLFNDFLSEAECDGLRRVHDKHVQALATPPLLCFDNLSTLRKHLRDVKQNIHVTPNDFVKGTRCVNASFSQQLGRWLAGNWSYSTAFYPGESRFSHVLAARVQRAMGLHPDNGGKFQITSYPVGKAYKEHTDCVLGGTDPRDRVASVLLYLDDVPDGGETRFPELGIWVRPRKGRALVWNNMSPGGRCEPHSVHAASKVNQGSKYILIRWYYYKSFYSLGKRTPEPPLPSRAELTPRVVCNDYDHGSCRWYDEWNNDHIVDYRQHDGSPLI